MHRFFNTNAHASSAWPTWTLQLQTRRWATTEIVLDSHIHTRDNYSFPCLHCSCVPFPLACLGFPLSFQFSPWPKALFSSSKNLIVRKVDHIFFLKQIATTFRLHPNFTQKQYNLSKEDWNLGYIQIEPVHSHSSSLDIWRIYFQCDTETLW